MPDPRELHFEDGFAGETVEVFVDGKLTESFAARTRLQSSLARVLPLPLDPHQTVTVAIAGKGAVSFSLDKHPFVRISLIDGSLVATPTSELPGHA